MTWLQHAWPWILGGGTVAAGIALFIVLRPAVGWKIALGIGGAVAAVGQFFAAIKRAENHGAEENEERQRQENLALEQRIAAAREAELRRQQETDGAINEDDPNLVDPVPRPGYGRMSDPSRR